MSPASRPSWPADLAEHAVVVGKNVALMDEMDLPEFLQGFDTIAGQKEHTIKAMRQPESMRVSSLNTELPKRADPLLTIRGLAAARKAI